MPKKIKTYLDTCVLIFAFRADNSEKAEAAWNILGDKNREFVFSDLLRIETIPKPTFHKKTDEVEFMNTLFEQCCEHCLISRPIMNKAIDLASKYNIAPMDALHVTVAISSGVDEFYTFEKKKKPMCDEPFQKELKVISLSREICNKKTSLPSLKN